MKKTLLLPLFAFLYFNCSAQDLPPSHTIFGNCQACLQAQKKYQGKHFILKAAAKAALTDNESSGSMFFKVSRADNKQGFVEMGANNLIKKNTWNYFTINGVIDTNAVTMCFGMQLYGEGKLWVDDITLSIQDDNGKWIKVKDFDGDFETPSKEVPKPWHQPDFIIDYTISITSKTAKTGKRSLLIASKPRSENEWKK